LFKKILPSKKLLRTLCSDEKFSKPTISKLGIKPFHVDNKSKTIIIYVKGTPIFLKALDLFLLNIFGN